MSLDFIRAAGTVVGLGMASWALGYLAYAAGLRAVWGQAIGEDAKAIAFWSALAYAPYVVCCLGPLMFTLAASYDRRKRLVVLPLAGLAAAVLPLAVVGLFWGRRSAVSPEAALFALLFGVAGATFGLGFAFVESLEGGVSDSDG
jgi:hypothetical protein